MQLPFLHIHNFLSPTAFWDALLVLGEDTPDPNHLLTIGTHGLVHHPPDHPWPLLVSLQRRGFSSSASADLCRAIIPRGLFYWPPGHLLAMVVSESHCCHICPPNSRRNGNWSSGCQFSQVINGKNSYFAASPPSPWRLKNCVFYATLPWGGKRDIYPPCNEKHFPRYARKQLSERRQAQRDTQATLPPE